MSEDGKKFEVPVDVSNEQVILVAMALDASACDRVLASVSDDHFLGEENRAVCSVLREMRRRRVDYEPAAFARFAGGRVREDYLSQLVDLQRTPTTNLDHHLDWLAWDRQKATMAAGPLSDLLEALQSPRADRERTCALARMVAQTVAGAVGSARFLREPKDLVRTSLEELLSSRASYPYGIDGLDFYEPGAKNAQGDDVGGTPRVTPGAAPGYTTVVTGLSGSGKSTLAFRMALGLARQKRRGTYLAWEPGGNMTLRLLACMALNWKRTNLLQKKDQEDIKSEIPREQVVKLEETMHKISRVIRVMENPFQLAIGSDGKESNERNFDLVQEHLAAAGGEWAIWDLFDRAIVDDRPSSEKRAWFRFQSMALDLKIHSIALVQQRLGDVEQRPDKRPTREGVKGSKAAVEIVETMIGTHRPAQWKRIPDDTFEAILLKQRYGEWPLAVSFDWDKERGSIRNGRSIEYDQPGERAGGSLMGDFVEPDKTPGGKRRPRR